MKKSLPQFFFISLSAFTFGILCPDLGFAAELKIKGLDLNNHKTFELKPDAAKKGVVITFLSANCPCSNSHVEELKKLVTDFPEFQFVGVHSNTDEDKKNAEAYFTRMKINFPMIQDDQSQIANEWKANKTPHAFLVTASGTTLYKGGVTDSAKCDQAKHFYLRDALTDVKAGKDVRTAETRVLGCAISRGDKNVW